MIDVFPTSSFTFLLGDADYNLELLEYLCAKFIKQNLSMNNYYYLLEVSPELLVFLRNHRRISMDFLIKSFSAYTNLTPNTTGGFVRNPELKDQVVLTKVYFRGT